MVHFNLDSENYKNYHDKYTDKSITDLEVVQSGVDLLVTTLSLARTAKKMPVFNTDKKGNSNRVFNKDIRTDAKRMGIKIADGKNSGTANNEALKKSILDSKELLSSIYTSFKPIERESGSGETTKKVRWFCAYLDCRSNAVDDKNKREETLVVRDVPMDETPNGESNKLRIFNQHVACPDHNLSYIQLDPLKYASDKLINNQASKLGFVQVAPKSSPNGKVAVLA